MLINVKPDGSLGGRVNISNPTTLEQFRLSNPTFIYTDGDFDHPDRYYEYKGGSISLRANWEDLLAEDEAADVIQRAEDAAAYLVRSKARKIAEAATLAGSAMLEEVVSDGESYIPTSDVIADIANTLGVMGRNPTEKIDFKGASGWALVNKASLQGLQSVIWARSKVVRANHRHHEEAITAISTQIELDAYDITTGWV